jgi:hypothetical protein
MTKNSDFANPVTNDKYIPQIIRAREFKILEETGSEWKGGKGS